MVGRGVKAFPFLVTLLSLMGWLASCSDLAPKSLKCASDEDCIDEYGNQGMCQDGWCVFFDMDGSDSGADDGSSLGDRDTRGDGPDLPSDMLTDLDDLAGDMSLNDSDISLTDGDLTTGDGDLTLPDGDLGELGDLMVPDGDIALTDGDLALTDGDLALPDGDILSFDSSDLADGGDLADLSPHLWVRIEQGPSRLFMAPIDEPGVAIPEGVGGVAIPMMVGPGVVGDLQVWVRVEHPEPSQLSLSLVAPDGTIVVLQDRPDLTGPNMAFWFDDQDAMAGVEDRRVLPLGQLADLMGRDRAGEWTLMVLDGQEGGEGSVIEYWLEFGPPNGPAGDFHFLWVAGGEADRFWVSEDILPDPVGMDWTTDLETDWTGGRALGPHFLAVQAGGSSGGLSPVDQWIFAISMPPRPDDDGADAGWPDGGDMADILYLDLVWPDMVLPDMVLPDMVLPDMVLPDMVMPDFVMPDFIWPDMVLPDMVLPDMVMPDFIWPDMTLPDMVLPDIVLPDMVLPDMVLPDIVLPDIVLPDMVLPDMVLPDMVLPDIVLPDIVLPDVAFPDFSLPDWSRPDFILPDWGNQDVAMPDVAFPDVALPDWVLPDVVLPDVVLPDWTWPDIVLPDMVMPDYSRPDFTMPDVVMPDFTMPDVVLPDMVMPDYGRPDIVLPDVAQSPAVHYVSGPSRIFQAAANAPIPDGSPLGVRSSVLVDTQRDRDDTVLDVQVYVEIRHPRVSDLEISLLHMGPSGATQVLLHSGGSNEYGDRRDIVSWFDDDCVGSCRFRPLESLSVFQGEIMDGTWTLLVRDDTPGSSGTLVQWYLEVGPPNDVNVRPFFEWEGEGSADRYWWDSDALPNPGAPSSPQTADLWLGNPNLYVPHSEYVIAGDGAGVISAPAIRTFLFTNVF